MRFKTSTLSFALLASERSLNAMMSWTIVTQVQAEVQAASTVIPSDSVVKKTESIIATCCHNQCEDQAGWDGLIFTLGMQRTLRQWMLALLWARPRSLPQGVLVVYFGSAASGVPVMWYGHIRPSSCRA